MPKDPPWRLDGILHMFGPHERQATLAVSKGKGLRLACKYRDVQLIIGTPKEGGNRLVDTFFGKTSLAICCRTQGLYLASKGRQYNQKDRPWSR